MQGKACKNKFDLLKTPRNVSPFWIFKKNIIWTLDSLEML